MAKDGAAEAEKKEKKGKKGKKQAEPEPEADAEVDAEAEPEPEPEPEPQLSRGDYYRRLVAMRERCRPHDSDMLIHLFHASCLTRHFCIAYLREDDCIDDLAN